MEPPAAHAESAREVRDALGSDLAVGRNDVPPPREHVRHDATLPAPGARR